MLGKGLFMPLENRKTIRYFGFVFLRYPYRYRYPEGSENDVLQMIRSTFLEELPRDLYVAARLDTNTRVLKNICHDVLPGPGRKNIF